MIRLEERVQVVAQNVHAHTDAAPHDAHHQPSVRNYVIIFVILFVVTMIEVAASWLTDFGVPQWGEILVLIALAVAKGLMVVMYYMHLRFDSRWFTFLFTSGMILAAFAIAVLITLFSYHAGLQD